MWHIHKYWLISANYFELVDTMFILSVMAGNLIFNRVGMWPYSLVTLPGTITHELSHFFMAKLFFANPSFPAIFPRREGDYWVMGSVSFSPTILNSIPIALAPLLLLPVGWLFSLYVFIPATSWEYAIYGWIAGNMFYACLPSSQDWKVAAPAFVVLIAGFAFALYFDII